MVGLNKKYLDSFIKGINKDFKWDFDPFYLDHNYDMDGFSFLYFYKYIIKRGNNVIDEIKENLLFMSVEKHLFYLNYVEERIKRDVVSNVDSSFLNNWVEQYNTINLEFPFMENPDLKIILSRNIDEYKGFVPSEDQKTIKIQKDFYHYAYYLEKNKIIQFLKNIKHSDNLNLDNDSELTPNKDVTNQNNLLKSTINDYLEEFKDEIKYDGYRLLVDALYEYFKSGEFPILSEKIEFKKINKKRVGWALKKLYQSETTDNLSIEYFRFAKDNINIFSQEVIDSSNLKKSKFYKYFTTNP
jgi:hypothetical protein